MTAMLASVRSLAEARLVADCGVPWIDLKEPADGALGAVAPAVIASVAHEFGDSHVISATIGDCWERPREIPGRVALVAANGAAYAKVGLHASALGHELQHALAEAAGQGTRVIAVCFAESLPTASEIEQLAALGVQGVMLDTAIKQGPGLLELLSGVQLTAFVATARGHGLLCGLAGKLKLEDIDTLLPLGADYLGFRSALCAAGERVAALDAAAVRRVMRKCHTPAMSPATPLPSLIDHPGVPV